MRGVHLGRPDSLALKPGDEALSPLLYTGYVNGSRVVQVQRLPFLPRKLSVYSHSIRCVSLVCLF